MSTGDWVALMTIGGKAALLDLATWLGILMVGAGIGGIVMACFAANAYEHGRRQGEEEAQAVGDAMARRAREAHEAGVRELKAEHVKVIGELHRSLGENGRLRRRIHVLEASAAGEKPARGGAG